MLDYNMDKQFLRGQQQEEEEEDMKWGGDEDKESFSSIFTLVLLPCYVSQWNGMEFKQLQGNVCGLFVVLQITGEMLLDTG